MVGICLGFMVSVAICNSRSFAGKGFGYREWTGSGGELLSSSVDKIAFLCIFKSEMLNIA